VTKKTPAKKKTRRKQAKDAWLRVRVTRAELLALDRAAAASGLDLSEWVRFTLTMGQRSQHKRNRGEKK
jgi:hypothetical protein